MRWHRSSFLICFALALLAAPQSANAAEQAQVARAESCGTTIESNLAAAREALQSGDKDTRPALACLIEAVTALNAQKPETVHDDGTPVIAVPGYKGVVRGTAQ